MKISKEQLEILASHIVLNLKCQCGLSYKESFNEPCACGWTPISDWFEDEFDMELKLYKESIRKFYKDNYNMEVFKDEN